MRRTHAPRARSAAASLAVAAAVAALVPAAAQAEPVASVTPGSSVLTVSKMVGNVADGRGCTVGFIGQRSDGSRVGVYAGHCGAQGQQVVVDGRIAGVNIASSAPRLTSSDTFVVPNAPDWGVFELDPRVARATPGGKIRPTSVGVAKAGDPVCSQGVSSGWRCGKVISVDNGYIATTIPVQVGDSGGPLVRSTDNAALGLASRAATFNGAAKPNGSLFYDVSAALNAAGLALVVG
ncbi:MULTISPECIES: S1 family peptidase [Tsukamurella]|uniref:S1 family peptidase n=1 Tax=Tsukamurella strandjordii TaxID=147577 RepID=A0AA90N9G4_9ACTN|nr:MULTISPECIES: S1 family peptidase [Tsukamurella]MDP0398116.1 S1 family peptidase [Tsukamurella strandjordii]GIZ98054.1 hypothetical protein TTY48_26660 [Tsukamurella sp. TY48]